MKLTILIIVLTLFFSSCTSDPYKKPLKIVVNSWVGYLPILYAKEQKWLEPYNIKIANVTSLGESLSLYNAQNANAFTGTQYEYAITLEKYKELTPIMLFDISNGGDMVMSNKTIEELQNSKEKIKTYLEIDSVNALILKDFLKHYKIDQEKIEYINKDQIKISKLQRSDQSILIVTYSPYNINLTKNGYKILASTKDSNIITVIDGLYATKKNYLLHEKQFKQLKIATDRAIEVIKTDPKKFYEVIKDLFHNMSYDEFLSTLQDIQWINNDSEDILKSKLKNLNFPLQSVVHAQN